MIKSSLIISEKNSLLDCLKLFKLNNQNILCVTRQKKFIGIITISDIRDALCKGAKLNTKIKNYYNSKPLIINGKINPNNVSDALSKNSFNNISPKIIPLVSKKKKVLNLVSLESLTKYPFQDHTNEKNKSIIILGGAGYIGSHLTKVLLKENYKVIVFDKFIYSSFKSFKNQFKYKNLKIIKSDTNDISRLLKYLRESKYVIHLAEMVGDPLCNIKPQKTYEINYLNTLLISTICKNLFIEKFIYISSCSVYGSNNKIVNELSNINPLSIYAKIKALTEKILIKNLDGECKPCILRLGTVYGNSWRQRYDLVINLFGNLIANNKKINIKNGNQWRPFIHINDVCGIILKILKSPSKKINGQIFNAVGENMSINHLGHLIQKKFNYKKIIYTEDNIDNRDYKASNKKMLNLLNYKPKMKISKEIQKIVEKVEKSKIKNINKKKYINFLNYENF